MQPHSKKFIKKGGKIITKRGGTRPKPSKGNSKNKTEKVNKDNRPRKNNQGNL
jgi:hypothetical protein